MTKQTEPYTPIACDLHSEYELAIMHRRSMMLTWQDENNEIQTAALLPLDLITRDKQEFLLARDNNNVTCEIRLDKIIKSEPQPENKS
jgi:Rho-binding antiterminator